MKTGLVILLAVVGLLFTNLSTCVAQDSTKSRLSSPDLQLPIDTAVVPQYFEAVLGRESVVDSLEKIQEFREERQDALNFQSMRRLEKAHLANDLYLSIALGHEKLDDLSAYLQGRTTRSTLGIDLTTAQRQFSELTQKVRDDTVAYVGLRREMAATDRSILNISRDLERSRTLMNLALSRSEERHQFKRLVSNSFLWLIGIIILSFFATVFLRSRTDSSLITTLLTETGLQFITLFVLIIAVVLFGILGILEGRELAAILSGIAGYVLGRGTIGARNVRPESARREEPEVSAATAPVQVSTLAAGGTSAPVLQD